MTTQIQTEPHPRSWRALVRLPARRRSGANRSPEPEPVSHPVHEGVRAFMYDTDGTDGEMALEDVALDQLTDRLLLWVDVASPSAVEAAAAALGLEPETVERIGGPPVPGVFVHDGYAHIVAVAPGKSVSGYEPLRLDCIAGPNWVLTVHPRPIGFLHLFDERIRGDSEFGRMDSYAFAAAILHEHIASYFSELSRIEDELDRVDLRVLTGRAREEALLRKLVALRLDLSRLRRLLAPHRDVYSVLGRTDFAVLAGSATDDFARLSDVLERALQSMEVTRDMLLGSFDVYTTWEAHSTNRIMKLLTVASVTLLPPTLLAGVMGMNSLPHSLTAVAVFWTTVAVIVCMGLTTLAFARSRGWI